MSTYYDFYAAVKKNDKIEAIGPYIRKEGEYRLVPIVTRSKGGGIQKRPHSMTLCGRTKNYCI